jgi:TatD DNase family protein
MLVDSHCHLDRLDLTPYNGQLDEVLLAAKQNDVGYILSVCVDLEGFPGILKIADKYPDVFASVGVHPTEVVTHEPSTEELIKLAKHPKVIAFGETGLDYYHETTDHKLQQQRFRNHIQAAIQTNKPLIVHTRQAREDTIKILREEQANECRGVLHCFTEDWDMASRGLDLNFYISISGIVTFKNATSLQEIAKKVPLDRLLIETDAPYLAPMPHRGKTNYPAYVRHTAEFIAQLRGVAYQEIAEKTTKNFFNLFKIKSQ